MDIDNSIKRLILSAGLGIFMFIVLARFAYVQLYLGESYLQASEKNRVRAVEIETPRGLLRDRYGEILVDNRPAYAVYAIPAELKNKSPAYQLLATAFHTNSEDLQKQIARNKRGNFMPVKIERQIDFTGLSLLYERRLELSGIDFRAESRRAYPSGIKAPHLFGYLGEISDAELTTFGEQYNPGDLIGKKGIEREYESLLRGKKGLRYVEVDALGRVVRDLDETDSNFLKPRAPEPGTDLMLGLDAVLQRMLEIEMTDLRGGAIVLNCKNGEVLALVSKPDYDPDLFSKPLSPQEWGRLSNDPNKPLYDRMVQSTFPPGSTFKIVLVIAGLETGLIDPNERVFCPGYFRLGNRSFRCWRLGGHGTVNLLQAIEQSCDVYFYRMGLKVGLEHWSNYAKRFGFGQLTDIDLVGERGGMVPDQEYLDQRYGRGRWSKGLILNLAIGQGELLVTPLQMACFAMAIANEGHSFRPRLRRGTYDSALGKEMEVSEPDSFAIKGINPRSYRFAKHGMYMVVNSPTGTAKSARVPGVISAGKTGTAQNPHGETHAWYIGFAPCEDPQIAFCIFLENGGGGGANAAPFARKIITLLYERQNLVSQPEKVRFSD
jgi:penicillin-binding protein 2